MYSTDPGPNAGLGGVNGLAAMASRPAGTRAGRFVCGGTGWKDICIRPVRRKRRRHKRRDNDKPNRSSSYNTPKTAAHSPVRPTPSSCCAPAVLLSTHRRSYPSPTPPDLSSPRVRTRSLLPVYSRSCSPPRRRRAICVRACGGKRPRRRGSAGAWLICLRRSLLSFLNSSWRAF
jgi:hypothetical protein